MIKGIIPIIEEPNFIDSLSGTQCQTIRGFGFRLAVGTTITGEDIWPGTATTLPIPPDVGEQMSVVSTNAQDGVGGTGVRSVMVHYIDANGVDLDTIVTMNGVTPVPTIPTNIRFVQEMHSVTTGTGLLSAGTISIATTGTPANIYTQIQPGTNQSLNTARMVPAGKTLIITAYHASTGGAAGGKSVDIRIRATSHEGLLLPRIFCFIDDFMSFNSSSDRAYTQPIFAPSLSIVKCTAYATSAGTDAQASWEGVLIDNPT